MVEKKLIKLLEEAKKTRERAKDSSFHNDSFDELTKFIMKKIGRTIFKKRNLRIIANHFDEILPFITSVNIAISRFDILGHIDLLIDQPNFKEKFIAGLKKYPYKEGIAELIRAIRTSNKYDDFLAGDILKVLATMNLTDFAYEEILDSINEQNQGDFLNYLVENNANIPYNTIKYKGNNKQIIYDNIELFIKKSRNLYHLMHFVRNDPKTVEKIKVYLDSNEDAAINSVFSEADHISRIEDPTIQDVIKLIIKDVVKNENTKYSEITYNSGGFSRVLLIGNKVIKIGDRINKSFPNNPYIVAPLLRKTLESNGESCFIEVTERVDTSTKASNEELYQLYKNLRDLGLIWTDIKADNVGRLRKENLPHWNRPIEPSTETLEFTSKRGNIVLKPGDLVILDADFIYDENDENINYVNNKETTKEFSSRYEKEKHEVLDNLQHIDTEEITNEEEHYNNRTR